MSYATPTLYIQRFGLDETTATLADEQQLLTSQLLLDAISVAAGGAWTGTPSDDEMAAANAALARITRQLAVSSNIMDGYLRAALTLPLPPDYADAGTLEECCLALVRCALNDDTDNATDRMDKCCDDWRKWLADVSKGVVQISGPGGEVPPAGGNMRVVSGQAVTAYDWPSFGGVPTPPWGMSP